MYCLTCDIVIDTNEGVVRLDHAAAVTVKKDATVLCDTLTLTLPRRIRWRNVAKNPVRRGDAIRISLGYDGRNRLAFAGYVRSVQPGPPLTIEAQDPMCLYQTMPAKRKAYASTTLNQLLADQGISATITGTQSIGAYRVECNTVSELLDALRKQGIRSMMRIGAGNAPAMYAGLAMQPADRRLFDFDGTLHQKLTEAIAAPWFDRFLRDALDTRFWGFSLFQFDTDRDGWPTCQLVRRKHVDPIRRIILAEQFDTHGTPWDEFYHLLPVGDPYDIGMLAKAARYVIYKNNDLGDWSEFAEIFGMPIREYTYDATDEESRRRMPDDAAAQGAAQVYIHPEGTSLKLIESANKSGSGDVYKALADFCNAELSKLFLGNTLTTQAGDTGTQALGTVQKQGEDIIMRDDRAYILNILNYQLTDLLQEMGFDTQGGRFRYAETEAIDLDKQLRIVQGLHGMGLDISPAYLYDKFGIQPPDEKEKAKQEQPEEPQPEEPENEKRQLAAWLRFFAEGAKRK